MNGVSEADAAWVAAAIALGDEARGTTAPNPNVGCVVVRDGVAIGRGATQPGGRPHAEAVALDAAGPDAAGATIYTSLEPCAHRSERGPACADLLVAARVARVVVATEDPDPRTAGRGIARLREARIAVDVGVGAADAARSMAGFLTRVAQGRPYVTLKLAQSIDGRIALGDGASRWITGEEARTHAHGLRARSDAILVGRGTYDAMPVSVLTDAQVAAVGAAHGTPVGAERFRANILVAAAPDAPPEREWAGRELRFGAEARVRLDWAIPRCAMVAINPDTADRDPEVLRTVVQAFGNRVGTYCAVTAPGPITVGDPVTLA